MKNVLQTTSSDFDEKILMIGDEGCNLGKIYAECDGQYVSGRAEI